MLVVLPIRTESVSRRTPRVNYLLIAANVVLFLLFDRGLSLPALVAIKEEYLVFQSIEPAFHQFITYQFMHAGVLHLLGNLLFLWVFGNGVNGKMGDLPYLLFYLAGGIFAAWGYAAISTTPFQLIGASGSIAAVTTAYLALFPRSRVTVMVWIFLFIHFFEWPAMILIGLKIIVWDNLLAPAISGPGNVAHYAHLAGYLFGFLGALVMLLVRAVARDQFDILALWRRWYLRREFSAAMSDPAAAARARYGSVARKPPSTAWERAAEETRLDELAALKAQVGESLERRELSQALTLFEQLLAADPDQCLSEHQQLEIGRAFYASGRFQQAAAAFVRFVECYPRSAQATEVRLLLGIIYARDLRQYELADRYLTQSLEALHDEERRAQCRRWLRDVRGALGREAPEEQSE